MLRGHRRQHRPLRVELSAATAAPPHRGHRGPRADGGRADDLQPRLPARAPPAARHHPPRRPAGAADRRDRPGRRRLRGVPAGGPLRLPGDDSRARPRHRLARPLRRADLEPHARDRRRAAPPMLLPLRRAPFLREGGAHHPRPGAGGRRRAGPGDSVGHAGVPRTAAPQGPRRRRDARLDPRADGAAARSPRRRRGGGDAGVRPEGPPRRAGADRARRRRPAMCCVERSHRRASRAARPMRDVVARPTSWNGWPDSRGGSGSGASTCA